ncbi:MAG: hypothetical protein KC431_22705, partial [Myxococcales bacterium]|nr:hypothetical protein [Myxococcales bacterium]
MSLIGPTPVEVFYQERELCEVELPLPLPGLVAWVESPDFELTRLFDGLAHPNDLRGPLLAAIPDLLQVEVQRAQARPDLLRRFEWWLLAMLPGLVLGDGSRGESELLAGFRRLRREQGLEAALEQFDQWLAHLEHVHVRELERVVARLRGRDAPLTAAAVTGALESKQTRRPGEEDRQLGLLRRALLPVLRALLTLPLFRAYLIADGKTEERRRWSLNDLLDHLDNDQPLAWVEENFDLPSPPAVELAVLGLDTVEQRLLQNLLGGQVLEHVGQWLTGRAKFERRHRISDLRLPAGAAAVTVEIDGDRVRGQLGIAADGDRRRSRIRIVTDGREVTSIELTPAPLALVGILEVTGLEMTAAHDDVSNDERKRLRELIEARNPALLDALCEQYPGTPRAQRLVLASLVRQAMVNWPPATGGYRARSLKHRKRFAKLALLPVFPGARKPWSAVELAEAAER